MVNGLFSARGRYSAVGQNDQVYEATTEANPESLSPTQAVFQKYLRGRFNRENTKTKWVFTTMVCGLCAISLGSVFVAVDPYEILFRMVSFSGKSYLAKEARRFVMWKKPEVDLFLKVYLFNVTNPEGFLHNGEKLRVREVGPYVYRERMSHENISFNENKTITAVPMHPLEYVPEMSGGNETDILTLPNIALLSFAQVKADSSIFTRMGVNLMIKQTGSQPLVEMTAKEFMFGYRSVLLTLGHKFLPSWISFDKLGLIDRMYDFDGDISTTYTGEEDIRRSGLLASYNRKTYLPQWNPPCNNLTGASDGTKFNSLINKDMELLFFRKSLCRSMPLTNLIAGIPSYRHYKGYKLVRDGVRVGEEVVKGIHAFRYEFKNHSLDNGEVIPENKCFCRQGRCLPSGILDVHECYYGFPIALSYPHFYMTDKKVQDSVEGMSPSHEKHSTFFVINDDAGLPLNVSVKMQINMAFSDLSKMSNVGRFSNMILPMLWTDIVMPELPTNMAIRFYIYLTVGPIAQILTTYILLIGGVAFILLSLASAVLIPKLNLTSSNRTPADPEWKNELPLAKKRNPGPSEPGNKEMDLYYCSLLAVQNDD